MKEYKNYLNEVFNGKRQNRIDEGFLRDLKDKAKNIWDSVTKSDFTTIISGILTTIAGGLSTVGAHQSIQSGQVLESIAWVLTFMALAATGSFLTVAGYFSMTSLNDIFNSLTGFLQGKIKGEEELERLSIKAQEIVNHPEMKNFKGVITTKKNEIRDALERKDWKDVWRYVQDLKKKLEKYDTEIERQGL